MKSLSKFLSPKEMYLFDKFVVKKTPFTEMNTEDIVDFTIMMGIIDHLHNAVNEVTRVLTAQQSKGNRKVEEPDEDFADYEMANSVLNRFRINKT